MIIEYGRKPPEALAYDELMTTGLMKKKKIYFISKSILKPAIYVYLYADEMIAVAGTD